MMGKRLFSVKDAFVFCLLFLVFSLGAVGSGGRRNAREQICLSHLREMGSMVEAYAGDHDGSMHGKMLIVFTMVRIVEFFAVPRQLGH